MAKFDKGRGVVLIGHSQGAVHAREPDQDSNSNPRTRTWRHLLVSALIAGRQRARAGRPARGRDASRTFPECTSAADHGALRDRVLDVPQRTARRRVLRAGPTARCSGGGEHKGMQVACVNPTLLVQNGSAPGALLPYAPDDAVPRDRSAPTSPTPTAADAVGGRARPLQAQCHNENGASWLTGQPGRHAGRSRRDIRCEELLGPEWGLHLYDISIALGNLVKTVGFESVAYELKPRERRTLRRLLRRLCWLRLHRGRLRRGLRRRGCGRPGAERGRR